MGEGYFFDLNASKNLKMSRLDKNNEEYCNVSHAKKEEHKLLFFPVRNNKPDDLPQLLKKSITTGPNF